MRVLPFLLVVVALVAGRLMAADPRPIVGPGATKDAVIDAYGWPTGQAVSGTKEILNYPQGQVTLENGRVEKVDFSMKMAWPPPRPRPGPPTATTVKKPESPVDFWLTNYEQAVAEAKRRRARILVLFTGPDWSPGSKQFQTDVEYHPDFVNAFTGDFVFLRLEFATRSPISTELRDQNNRLRERYGVTTYPALIVITSSGAPIGAVDLTKPQPGETYRDRVIAAVREVRDLLALRPPEPVATADAVAVQAATPEPVAAPAGGLLALGASLGSAGWLLTSAIALGLLIAIGLFWLTWGSGRAARPAPTKKSTMAARISDAASGLPSTSDLAEWPREKICALVAALAESDGYVPEILAKGNDKDLVLRRAGDTQPRVLVCCAIGGGSIPAKRVRELFGTLTAEGVEVGWFVAPGGFAPETRTYSAQHNIMLLDGERLLDQLRDLPPMLLPKVLGRLG